MENYVLWGMVLFVFFLFLISQLLKKADSFKKEYEDLLTNEECKVKGRFE